MSIKWFGAILIIAGCGSFGFCMAATHRREEQLLRQLLNTLDFIECELQFHMTPLPELCRNASHECKGLISQIMLNLSVELDSQTAPDAASCMNLALMTCDVPKRIRGVLDMMSISLGRFDLDGQVKGLEAARSFCRQELEFLLQNRETRLRSYQTLGLCAGAALAILFV